MSLTLNYMKRIFPILFLCFIGIAPADSAAQRTPSQKVMPKPEMPRIQRSDSIIPRRMTFDDIRRKRDLKNAGIPALASPDFKYPATVAAHADSIYSIAMAAGHPVTALRAAMEWNVANAAITPDSVVKAMQRYRELAQQLPHPYSALALLLEGDLIRQVYNSNQYTFNSRTLAELSEDPRLWSAAQMEQRIREICASVMSMRDPLVKLPIAHIAPLITESREAEKCAMTVFDFACYRMISLLEPFTSEIAETSTGQPNAIPFINRLEPTQSESTTPDDAANPAPLTPLSVTQTLIEADSLRGISGTAALLQARLHRLELLSGKQAKSYADRLLDIYPLSSSDRPTVVAQVAMMNLLPTDTPDEIRSTYELISATIKAHPKSPAISFLTQMTESLTRPSVTVDFLNQTLSSGGGSCNVNISNLKECYLLLIKLPDSTDPYYGPKQKIVRTMQGASVLKHIITDGRIPLSYSDTIGIPALAPGLYTILPSATNTTRGCFSQLDDQEVEVFNVSDISAFTVKANKNSKAVSSPSDPFSSLSGKYLYVTDARSGAPIEGAKVRLRQLLDSYPKRYGKERTFLTDSDGKVELPVFPTFGIITHNGSQLLRTFSHESDFFHTPDEYAADILTDLAIYHPGDTVQWVAVMAHNNANILSPAASFKAHITMYDANNQKVASTDVVTDYSGRATGSFAIPTSGITGTFRIVATPDADISAVMGNLGSQRFQVAEYKAPTFMVSIHKTELTDDTATISGAVTTYSGMPLADTEVQVNIGFHQRWWRLWRGVNLPGSFSASVITDGNGQFTLPLGLENIMGTPYETGYFTIDARATSPAGETQSGSGSPFAVAPGFMLALNDATIQVNSDSIRIPVKVLDAIEQPARRALTYTVENAEGKVMARGETTSPLLTLKSDLLPSGRYTLRAILPDARRDYENKDAGLMLSDTATCTITLWRDSDTRPPYPTALWIPRKQIYGADDDATSTPVVAGNSYPDSWLFYQIADCDSVLQCGWVKASEANAVVTAPVPKPGNVVRVTFRGLHDLNAAIESVTVRPAESRRRLSFRTETFRDRLTPMAGERWRFRLLCDSLPSGGAAVMAVLSDAALNAITPFDWSMDPQRIISYYIKGSVAEANGGYPWRRIGGMVGGVKSHHGSYNPIITPAWDIWGHPLYQEYTRLYRSADKFKSCAEAVIVTDMANLAMAKSTLEEEISEDSCDADAGAGEAGRTATQGAAESEIPDIPLRDTSCPLAFFRPLLTTDADGMVTIDFDVPNFNTTWALQLMAYDERMRTADLNLEAIASKPAMITTNMPRFLLTGDKARVEATMFNNSDTTLPLTGIIEIFNPVTGKVIASHREKNVKVLPSGNAIVGVSFDTPSDLAAIGVRASVECPDGSDGEQQLIQVLPAAQPVMDATTFYLTPGDADLSVLLPRMNEGDRITLNYCANPAWYVLTSLSGLIEADSESTLANLNSLYANVVATGLLNRYPSLREGLEKIFSSTESESLITSPLKQNEELKIAALGETPWVNNAASETARMHSLTTLTDAAKADKLIKSIIDILARNQKNNGSFSWMPQMEGSEWISLNVIDCAARIKESGYTPNHMNWEDMVKRTLDYTDAYEAKEYRKWVKEGHTFPLSSEITYLLNRSILTDSAPSGGLAEMQSDMMKRLPTEWGDLSIADKTRAARLLHRKGQDALALDIMRSVLEFASYKPNKGMWFDNLPDAWYALPPKVVTADCLMALNEVMPGDDAIMKMCQYLVLSRQGEDWNVDMSPGAVTATANAVLCSDLGWTDLTTAPAPEITLGGRRLTLPSEAQMLTGNFYLDLTPSQASGRELKITRPAGVPAWGGVLRQYLMPAAEVKAASVPQMSVTKQLLPITLSTSGEVAGKDTGRFSKGDLIRVTLILQTDRDLDYVMIRDCRGAFMQPKEQLTQYEVNDGIWVLRETRNTATNFFLTRLPKGQYILTYDVYADRDGEYSTGIATAQSQYYPLITAHSAGALITVK